MVVHSEVLDPLIPTPTNAAKQSEWLLPYNCFLLRVGTSYCRTDTIWDRRMGFYEYRCSLRYWFWIDIAAWTVGCGVYVRCDQKVQQSSDHLWAHSQYKNVDLVSNSLRSSTPYNTWVLPDSLHLSKRPQQLKTSHRVHNLHDHNPTIDLADLLVSSVQRLSEDHRQPIETRLRRARADPVNCRNGSWRRAGLWPEQKRNFSKCPVAFSKQSSIRCA